MSNFTDMLTDKDDKRAYAFTKELLKRSEISDELLSHMEEMAALLSESSSYVRTRAFMLLCAQNRWDKECCKKLWSEMSPLLHDPKPTVVRQCLASLRGCYGLREDILAELDTIDLSAYKDSMAPLLWKDMEKLRESLENGM